MFCQSSVDSRDMDTYKSDNSSIHETEEEIIYREINEKSFRNRDNQGNINLKGPTLEFILNY